MSTLSINRIIDSEKIFNIQKEIFGSDLDTSKQTLQGFLNDVISESLSSMITTSTLRQDERFINTARLESSIDLISSEYSYNTSSFLSPSEVDVICTISLLPSDNTVNSFILESNTSITYDNLFFMLPGDIKFERNTTNNDWFVKQINSTNFEYINGDLPSFTYIDENSVKHISFVVRIKQLNRSVEQIIVPTRNRLYYTKLDVAISNKTSDVRIYYLDAIGNKVYLERVNGSFNNFTVDTTKEIFLLKVGQSGYEIWLESGVKSKFIKSATVLYIEKFESDGDIGVLYKPSFLVEVPQALNPRLITMSSQSSSKTGVSNPTFLERKEDLINHIQTPNFQTIISDLDFKNIVNKYVTNINSGDDVSLVMRRNDPIVRMIDLFVKLKNKNNDVMFTNSLNYEIFSLQCDNFELF